MFGVCLLEYPIFKIYFLIFFGSIRDRFGHPKVPNANANKNRPNSSETKIIHSTKSKHSGHSWHRVGLFLDRFVAALGQFSDLCCCVTEKLENKLGQEWVFCGVTDPMPGGWWWEITHLLGLVNRLIAESMTDDF